MTLLCLTGLLVMACLCLLAQSAVQMPSLFSDHMVLQQDKRLPVWGRAKAGERVKLTLDGQTRTTIADADEQWRVEFDPLSSRDDALEMRVSGENEIVIRDILVGDVWLCGGQSNMEWPLSKTHDATKALQDANVPTLRTFRVQGELAFAPRGECRGVWQTCTPESAADFSAVGHHFARQLQSRFGRPIGLIGSYWGGTPAEAWMTRDALSSDPELVDLARLFDDRRARLTALRAQFLDELLPAWGRGEASRLKQIEIADAAWKAEAARAEALRLPMPAKPPAPPPAPHPYLSDPVTPHQPCVLNYGMIAPLKSMALKGIIWYQGESNDRRPWEYPALLRGLIRDWRNQFKQSDLPFLYVQLASHRERPVGPSHHAWCLVREGQLRALSVPHTGMVSAIDLGEVYDVHPRNKRTVGERLALAARAVAYGEAVEWSGPLYDRMTREGTNRLRVHFTHAQDGLMSALPRPQPDTAAPIPTDTLVGFTIAGEDRRFYVADAMMDGATVVVRSDHVPAPVAVRYGWASNPEISLYNRAGLPASPFRTDDWPFPR
jgi:sialate O-acetylesterase